MGKQSPALFELIREHGINKKSMPIAQQTRPVHLPAKGLPGAASAPAPANPSPVAAAGAPKPEALVSESKPRVRLATPAVVGAAGEGGGGATQAPQAHATGGGRGRRGLAFRVGDKQVTLSASAVSIGAVALVVLAVIVYSTGYRRGEAREARKAQQELEMAGVRDPLRPDSMPVNPSILASGPGSQAGMPAPRPPATKTAPPGSTPQRPGPVAATGDTREVGLNYAIAASRLDQEGAERAAGFLRENGVRAISVLEGGGSGSNNTRSWRVVVLEGITAEEYRSRGPVRTRVEARLTELGEVYRKDPKGRVDFGQYGWEKKKE